MTPISPVSFPLCALCGFPIGSVFPWRERPFVFLAVGRGASSLARICIRKYCREKLYPLNKIIPMGELVLI